MTRQRELTSIGCYDPAFARFSSRFSRSSSSSFSCSPVVTSDGREPRSRAAIKLGLPRNGVQDQRRVRSLSTAQPDDAWRYVLGSRSRLCFSAEPFRYRPFCCSSVDVEEARKAKHQRHCRRVTSLRFCHGQQQQAGADGGCDQHRDPDLAMVSSDPPRDLCDGGRRQVNGVVGQEFTQPVCIPALAGTAIAI